MPVVTIQAPKVLLGSIAKRGCQMGGQPQSKVCGLGYSQSQVTLKHGWLALAWVGPILSPLFRLLFHPPSMEDLVQELLL